MARLRARGAQLTRWEQVTPQALADLAARRRGVLGGPAGASGAPAASTTAALAPANTLRCFVAELSTAGGGRVQLLLTLGADYPRARPVAHMHWLAPPPSAAAARLPPELLRLCSSADARRHLDSARGGRGTHSVCDNNLSVLETVLCERAADARTDGALVRAIEWCARRAARVPADGLHALTESLARAALRSALRHAPPTDRVRARPLLAGCSTRCTRARSRTRAVPSRAHGPSAGAIGARCSAEPWRCAPCAQSWPLAAIPASSTSSPQPPADARRSAAARPREPCVAAAGAKIWRLASRQQSERESYTKLERERERCFSFVGPPPPPRLASRLSTCEAHPAPEWQHVNLFVVEKKSHLEIRAGAWCKTSTVVSTACPRPACTGRRRRRIDGRARRLDG